MYIDLYVHMFLNKLSIYLSIYTALSHNDTFPGRQAAYLDHFYNSVINVLTGETQNVYEIVEFIDIYLLKHTLFRFIRSYNRYYGDVHALCPTNSP